MNEFRTEDECKACEAKFTGIIEKLELTIKTLENRISELEARLNKDSHNSGKPPSTDNPYKNKIKNNREKSGKKSGGQFGHKGTTLKKVENPDIKILVPVVKCEQCKADLANVPTIKHIARQSFDIPKITRIVTEFQGEVKDCPCCGRRNRAEFPANVVNHTQYGDNIKAHILYLKNQGLMPYERLAEHFLEVMGVQICQATIDQFQQDISGNLVEYEDKMKSVVLKASVIHVDETGHSIKGELNWLHVIATDFITLYFSNKKRGAEGMREIGILDQYTGTCIHDGWKSYYDFLCRHGLCNVHHLRELLFAYEEMKQDWAWDMGGLLKQIKSAKEENFPISIDQMNDFDRQFDQILEKGYLKNPVPPKIPGKRGRQARGKTLCLLDRLKEHKAEVLLFMREKDVPFSNNLAERDIRMMKLQQKISGTFRSDRGAVDFCRIRGFISTMRKRGHSIYQALVDALNGNALAYAAE